MSSHDDAEVRFALALVKLLKFFNLLDTNVGLCLSFLISPSDPESAYEQLSNKTTQQRFEEMKAFVADGTGFPKAVDPEHFGEWLTDATRARAIRNRYVHGNWEYLPYRQVKPIAVRAPTWMKGKLGEEAEERMTVAELEAVADEVEQVFHRFMKIRRAHGI
jgi:hypothetical protein